MSNEIPIGAILCGGEAKRLGGIDKAAIEIDGATLASRAVDLLRPHCEELIALTGRRESFPVDGVPVVRDRFPGRGPLSGLDAAFRSRPGRTIFLLAVDLCAVPVSVASRLIDALRERPDAPAILPRTQALVQPVFALYRPGLADEVESRIEAGRPLSMRELAELGHAVDVPYQPGVFAGVNLPEDLARLSHRGK